MHWELAITGSICCIAGIYLFVKNVYEDGKTVFNAVMFMILGVLLIGWGTAIFFGFV